MRDKKSFLLVGLLLTLFFPLTIRSTITSRIEGQIVDAKTKSPIMGAKVELYNCINMLDYDPVNPPPPSDKLSFKWAEALSNESGFFKIDELPRGVYYFFVVKEGYSIEAPVYDVKRFVGRRQNIFDMVDIPKNIDKIDLQEGQVKHIKIELKKEAVLRVSITRKYPTGVTMDKRWRNQIVVSHPSFLYPIRMSFENDCEIKGLKAGLALITIWAEDYDKIEYKVNLENGNTNTINQILDYTDGQVLFGTVTIKNTNSIPPNGIEIVLEKTDENYSVEGYTDEYGKYFIGGLKPGEYRVKTWNISLLNRMTGLIHIKENEKKELNIKI